MRPIALLLVLPLAGAGTAQESRPTAVRDPRIERGAAEARAGYDRALAALLRMQRPDGAFALGTLENSFEMVFSVETFHAWRVAAHALACLALIDAPVTPERTRALERGLEWFGRARAPLRGNDWDNDAVWGWVYGVGMAVRASQDPRWSGTELGTQVERRGREYLGWLERNQVPEGGFGYYDDPTFSRRPKWATSFTTAAVIPALVECRRMGWSEDGDMLRRAAEYLRRCRLPNGAVQYDLRPVPRSFVGESIDTVKGSLGRIQVANWALHHAGDPGTDVARVRAGVELFFTHDHFLRVARMRPIPHEAYYANAGYFFLFGHYYVGQTIQLLPEAEREAWHRKLRGRLLAVQRDDGSFCDFLGSSYLVAAGTAFGAMALRAGLPDR